MVLLKLAFIIFIVFIITPVDAGCRRKKNNPCENNQAPLQGYFCGRGPTRQDCPPTYHCIIAPNDAYAVCCPRSKKTVAKSTKAAEKPGSCPAPKTGYGSCIAKCSDDSNCKGALKCCGNCPRECVQPVLKQQNVDLIPA